MVPLLVYVFHKIIDACMFSIMRIYMMMRNAMLYLTALRVFAWLCTKDYMQLWQELYKRWSPGNLSLRVELSKMLNVPGVAHR